MIGSLQRRFISGAVLGNHLAEEEFPRGMWLFARVSNAEPQRALLEGRRERPFATQSNFRGCLLAWLQTFSMPSVLRPNPGEEPGGGVAMHAHRTGGRPSRQTGHERREPLARLMSGHLAGFAGTTRSVGQFWLSSGRSVVADSSKPATPRHHYTAIQRGSAWFQQSPTCSTLNVKTFQDRPFSLYFFPGCRHERPGTAR